MIKIILLSLVFFITGCATNKPSDIATIETIRIDPRVLEPCKDLQFLSNNPTYDDLINNTINMAEAYLDCRKRQEASIVLLRKFANIKDSK